MSEPTQCRRYGCTCDGHPALDGYCSCECRDVQEARDECGSLIGLLERERALHNQCDGVKQSQAAEIERLRALLTRVIAHDDHIERDDDYYTMTHDLRCDIDDALASTVKPDADKPEEVEGICELCGKPMPPGEEAFRYHGYSGPCPTDASTDNPNEDSHE